MMRERAAKFAHHPHPLIKFCELGAQEITHALTFLSAASGQKLANLVKRKPKLLSLFDKFDSLNCIRRKKSESTF